jgi:hypothetical protein
MVTLVVKVVKNDTGRPVKGVYVSVGCDEFFSLWTKPKTPTNAEGLAQFVGSSGFEGISKANEKDRLII